MKKNILIFLLIPIVFLGPLSVKAQNVSIEQQKAIVIQKIIDLLLRQIQFLQEQINILIANQKANNQAIQNIQNSPTILQPQTKILDIPIVLPIVSSTTADADIERARQKELTNKNMKLWELFKVRHHRCGVFRGDSFTNSNQEWCDNNTGVGVDVSEFQTGIIVYCEKNPCKCYPKKTAEDRIICPW